MFWQKDLETISRDDLAKLQLARLKDTAARVYKNVPFYTQKFDELKITPDSLKTLADVARLPFTTREDLRANYPYGMLAQPRDEAVRLHTSSGTTGKPKAMFFSMADIDQAAELMARCLVMSGLTKADVLQNMMTYGLFTGALMMHYGAEKVGALVVPAGPGNTEKQITLMEDFGTTSIHITPSYALYLIDVLEKKGLHPQRDLKLKRAYVGAEPYSEATRKKIEEHLGIDVFNCYGLSEMNGPGVAFECRQKHGLHLWEDNFILEIIDPATGQELPDGTEGEMVLTTLCRGAMPIIRYRVGDLTAVIPEKCPCGRTHRKISRITGRVDDMFIIRGVNIFPQQIERILMGIKGVGRNYQIVLESLDEMTVRVELQRELFDGSFDHLVNLQHHIADAVKQEIIVRPKVELMEPGSLPVFEGKGKRVIDNRTL